VTPSKLFEEVAHRVICVAVVVFAESVAHAVERAST
jgi:hypothetical protein